MDSKRKYLRNRHWKGKYHPRNDTAVIKRPLEKRNNLVINAEYSDSEPELRQPIPKEGWFPKYDSSSSDFEDLESLTKFSNLTSILNCKIQTKNDNNWFDKELDDIQLNSKISIHKLSIQENQNDTKSIQQEFFKCTDHPSNYKNKNRIMKKRINEENSNKVDSEEELDFLLSLKEPVYTGPLITKKNYKNESKLNVLNNKYMEQKPIKSFDLEKWLDSVLDD